jgi:hypothetical protein
MVNVYVDIVRTRDDGPQPRIQPQPQPRPQPPKGATVATTAVCITTAAAMPPASAVAGNILSRNTVRNSACQCLRRQAGAQNDARGLQQRSDASIGVRTTSMKTWRRPGESGCHRNCEILPLIGTWTCDCSARPADLDASLLADVGNWRKQSGCFSGPTRRSRPTRSSLAAKVAQKKRTSDVGSTGKGS